MSVTMNMCYCDPVTMHMCYCVLYYEHVLCPLQCTCVIVTVTMHMCYCVHYYAHVLLCPSLCTCI